MQSDMDVNTRIGEDGQPESAAQSFRVLFVCLGNICRSVAAEMTFNAAVQAAGLADHVEADSCGTANYHVGQKPDARMLAALERAGFAYNGHRGRQFSRRDFADFDLAERKELVQSHITRQCLTCTFDYLNPCSILLKCFLFIV